MALIRLTDVAEKNKDSSAERSQPQKKTCSVLDLHMCIAEFSVWLQIKQ